MINENRILPYHVSGLPVEDGPWLVFAPHADDETFGMGGTILKAVREGIRVEVVVMTDGALGGSGEDLAETRRREAVKACIELGAQPPVFLDNRDRALAINDRTIGQVRDQIDRVRPAAVFFPGAFEPHPDHRAAALLVWRCLQSSGEPPPVAVSYEVLTQSPVNTLVDITAAMPDKARIMGIYASQLAENRYIRVATSLNSLRTATLVDGVDYAEGFYRFHRRDLEADFEEVVLAKIRPFFDA